MKRPIDDTVARELLAAARTLARRASPGTRGLWPRASALLARQALEVALRTFWSAKAPGAEQAPMRAQLLSLELHLPSDVARDAHHTWAALSRACHHHPYELSPTANELEAWCQTVARVVERTEEGWQRAARK